MHEANPVATHCDRSSSGTEDSVGSHVAYREAVGYLIGGTCPDIAFAVLRATRALDRPTEADWIDVKRVVKYLRGTSNYGLLFTVCNIKGMLEAFSDAGFAGDVRQENQRAAWWLCMQAVKLRGQANGNGQWNSQQQKQNLSQKNIFLLLYSSLFSYCLSALCIWVTL